jgi:short-subunit dehydrogenase
MRISRQNKISRFPERAGRFKEPALRFSRNHFETTLITGSSSGIGLELARQFAAHGHPLVLTAPVNRELQALGEELQARYQVDVLVIPKDLEQREAAQQIFDELADRQMQIDILVNNAGLGHRGKFWEIQIDSDLSMIRLNIEAVVRLTKLFLPPMLARRRGRILNTASIAGFEPGPLLAVYHATKAFVLSFSQALTTELEDTDVSVTALCPGATDTDFFPKAGMLATRAFQKNKVMAPQEVAELGYEALMRSDPIYVAGGMNRALVASRRVLTKSAQAKKNQKFYEDVPMTERKRKRGDIEAKFARAGRHG